MSERRLGPLLTQAICTQFRAALSQGASSVECSLNLQRSVDTVGLSAGGFDWQHQHYPFIEQGKDRTVYYWTGASFAPAARFGGSLIKLVPTQWGAPTFEIDGIKMLPSERISPFADAQQKVAMIEPRGKAILDTCGGLGYFGAWCLAGQARRIVSYERNSDVIWLRSLNPWSPAPADALTLIEGDVRHGITSIASSSINAVLHDPPRFGIAGELYSLDFYLQLARVLRRRGKMFHYTGTPNKLSSGRDLPVEVATRLRRAGFSTRFTGDGVLATKD